MFKPILLLPNLGHISALLLLKDALEDAVAADLVHTEDFVSYDSIDTLGRQVIEHAPVIILVHEFVLESLGWVLGHIGPLSPHRELLKERRVLMLNDADLLLCFLIVHLI